MTEEKTIKKAKEHFGKEITKCRGKMTPAQLAKQLGISRSYMKGIEDGIGTPSPEMYTKIKQVLQPSEKACRRMDCLYMKIRKAPPPDVCEIFSNDPEWIDVFRNFIKSNITAEQIKQITGAAALMQTGPYKGENQNE